MDDGFDDMTESEFDEAFEASLPVTAAEFDARYAGAQWTRSAPPTGSDEAFNRGAKGFTCNPARISLISFTGSPGITLDGA